MALPSQCLLVALLARVLLTPSAASGPVVGNMNECMRQYEGISTDLLTCTLQDWCNPSHDCGERLEVAMKSCAGEDAEVWEEDRMANVSVKELAVEMRSKCGNACYEEIHAISISFEQGEEGCGRVQELESKCTSSDTMWSRGSEIGVAQMLKRECSCTHMLQQMSNCSMNVCNESSPCHKLLQDAEDNCSSMVVDEEAGTTVSNWVEMSRAGCATCMEPIMSWSKCSGNETDMMQFCNQTTACGQTFAFVLENCSMFFPDLGEMHHMCKAVECAASSIQLGAVCGNSSAEMCNVASQCGQEYRTTTDCMLQVPSLMEVGFNMSMLCNPCIQYMQAAMQEANNSECDMIPSSLCDINSDCGRMAHTMMEVCDGNMPNGANFELDMFMQAMQGCRCKHGKPINAEFARKINARTCMMT